MSDVNYQDWAAAYALGALEPEEQAEFEAELERRPELREAVSAHSETLIAFRERTPPSPDLRARILARAGGSAAPPRPAQVRWLDRAGRVPWLVAAASLVLALFSVAIARTATVDRAALGDDVSRLEAALEAAGTELTDVERAVEVLMASRLHSVALQQDGGPSVARVFWNHDDDRFVVTAFELPRIDADEVYQLWALADGRNPVSMGTFTVDARGNAIVVLDVTPEVAALGFVPECGLSVEAAGGAERPSGDFRWVGSWIHAE